MRRDNGKRWLVSDSLVDVYDVNWSTEGDRLAFVGMVDRDTIPNPDGADPENAYGGIAALYTAAVDQRRVDVVARLGHHPGYAPMAVDWSPQGKRIAVTIGTLTEGTVYDVVLERRKGGRGPAEPEAVAPRAIIVGRIVGPAWWAADRRSLNVPIESGMRQSIYRVDMDRGSVQDLFPDLQWYGVPSVAADRRTIAVARESITQPSRILLGTVDRTVALREVVAEAFFDPRNRRGLYARFDTVSWQSADGRWTIHGILITPTTGKPPRGWPLVVALSGGGSGPHMEYGVDLDYEPVLPLAAAGYAILLPSSRGRLGFGAAFLHAREDERTYFSKPWVSDVVPGVNLVVSHGVADPERLGIIGYSYDGALAAYGITNTHAFKAAILKEAAGIDLRMGPRIYWGIPFLRANGRLAFPSVSTPYDSASLAWLDRESPITHVAGVRTPTLLEFGVKNIDAVFDGNPFFQALQYYGVPSKFVVYPRTAHAFEEPRLILDSLQRELAWFEQWLGRPETTGNRSDTHREQ